MARAFNVTYRIRKRDTDVLGDEFHAAVVGAGRASHSRGFSRETYFHDRVRRLKFSQLLGFNLRAPFSNPSRSRRKPNSSHRNCPVRG